MSVVPSLDGLKRFAFVTKQMIRRDIAQRYRGSVGGLFWALVQPLLMLMVYTLVFGSVLKVKWPGVESTLDYALILFIGLVPYMFVSESLSRAPALIVGSSNLVKKVVFPLHVLPVMAVSTAALHALIALVVWAVFFACVKAMVPWAVVVLPLLWLPLIVATLGVSWAFAALGTYFRDLIHAIGPITLALMFLSPIFYSVQMAPAPLKPFLALNPMTFAIESARALMFHSQWPSLTDYAWQLLISLVVAASGLLLFQRSRTGFVDAL